MAFIFGQALRLLHGLPNRNVMPVQEVSFVRAVTEWESFREALQKPLPPSRMKQKCFVRLYFTMSEDAVFLSG